MTLGPVQQLATQVVAPFEPGLVLNLLESERSALFGGVPTMILALLGHPGFAGADFASLRVAFSGGATVPPALVERVESALGIPFSITFAQTEASPCITQTRPDDPAGDRARTLGRPHPHVPDDHWGEQVAAFIKPAPGHTATAEELTAYCHAHLAAHKTPPHWVFTDAFPLTGSGKVQKFPLREQFSSGPSLPGA